MKKLSNAVLATLLLSSTAAAGDGWYHLEALPTQLGGGANFNGVGVELSRDWAFASVRELDSVTSVQVFRRNGGQFEPVQVLSNPGEPNASFGNRTHLEGDVLFVADSGFDLGLSEDIGVVRVFRLGDDGWEFSQSLLGTAPSAGDHFGTSIDADGDWLAIGARQGTDEPGHVAVFRQVDGSFEHVADLESAYGPNLGRSVAIQAAADGESAFVVAGVPYYDGQDGQDPMVHSGAVVPFRVDSEQVWSGAALEADGLEDHDYFGMSLALAGNKLIVGANGVTTEDSNGGAVFVYSTDLEAGLLPQFDFIERLASGGPSAQFGTDLDYDPDSGRLAVGARFAFTSEDNKPGKVIVFRPAIFGDGFELEEELWHSGGVWGDQFGANVAVADRWIFSVAGFSNNIEEAFLFSLNPTDGGEGLAPANVLAVADSYGPTTGPVFEATSYPVPGQTAVIGVSPATPGHLPFVVGGTAPAALPLFGATLLVADPNVLVLPPVSQFGSIGAGWNVPDAPVMYGAEFYAQFWFVNPFALPALEVEASNGLRFTVGV